MARGIERRKMFLGEKDYEDFLRRLEKANVAGGAQVLAWGLLPDHLHVLLGSEETGLPTLMRRAKTGYAATFNLRPRRPGIFPTIWRFGKLSG
jgi:REP element-mobilizing transposase RayT